ncbi:MAG TPA: hypothetical protein VEU47_19025 [Candidatus Cybelea sp.]|nr:hypothetical protein [Candidatus Cybelea sp.]
MQLVRHADIAKVEPDTGGYMVTHTDGSRVHVPFRADHPDYHIVQAWLRGVTFGSRAPIAAEGPATAPAPAAAEPHSDLPALPAQEVLEPEPMPSGRVVRFFRRLGFRK